ncbi:lactate dehydrogenase [Caproiciproducens sp. NJN-50]|uniref:D-isomer specific 2-hydroxyacid dehydrogenase family protein n=1 Tax=Acutalibacteraceae TaxID=3082771 RepID=UPI000FFE2AC8|nr:MULTISPECIES: D-isomer specific 2-hydroxyacid dehydrogenase family protein [Acutalibacteraceae]QAT48712.1 lactate dehydrogenase [Caproiciproducens sp. NJN-50]
MKITIYSCSSEEEGYLEELRRKYGVELFPTKKPPTAETAALAGGSQCISIVTTAMDEELLKIYHNAGVRFISTRSIGYDHIDLKAAERLGMHIGNVSYSPNSVADYTVMLMLMAIRRVKAILLRSANQDYSLRGLQGLEMHNLTVGVIGTGRIGRTVLQNLTGFGCRLLAYDLHPNDSVKKIAGYVSLPELLRQSDLITLHMPATEENFHMIRRDTILQMKDGVILVNTARGSLIHTGDFLDAVESGKIGGAALDVVEGEEDLYYKDLKSKVLDNRGLALLKSYPNVLVTPHMAFHTNQAVKDMAENSVKSCVLFSKGEEIPWQII